VLAEASFAEAADLAYFGARVLHPATIRPAVEKGIPVWILNSMNPSARGTRISGGAANAPGRLAAVSFQRGVSTVVVTRPRAPLAYGFLAEVLEVFARHRAAVYLVVTSEVSLSLTVDGTASLPALAADLRHLGDVRVERGMGVVTLVGRAFAPRTAVRILQAVRELDVTALSFGASGGNLCLLVGEADVEAAVRAVHREFFERQTALESPAELAGGAVGDSWRQEAS
jgi:aspartate kinase